MSAVSGSPVAPSLRRLPFTVRLAPAVVNQLLARVGADEFSATGVTGALYGNTDDAALQVRHCAGLSNGAAIDQPVPSEAAGNARVGWFAVRRSGGLLETDIAFHDRHFPQSSDVALILRPDQEDTCVIEMYCRSTEGVLSESAHRWGLLRLQRAAKMAETVDVTMRAIIRDDFYLRAYQTERATDESPARNGWKRMLAKQRSAAPPLVQTGSGRLWLWLALVFATASAATFGVVRLGLLSRDSKIGVNAATPLGLKFEGQRERLLVTWNRNSEAARNALTGNLWIDDGAAHRKLELDSQQLANGSVLYSPLTSEVVFQLEIWQKNGTAVSESMRVLDASRPGAARSVVSTQQRPPEGAATPPVLRAPMGDAGAARGASSIAIENAPHETIDNAAGASHDTPGRSSNYQPPKPLRQVMPNLNVFAPGVSAGTGQVQISVKVDRDGHVAEARLLKSSQTLNGAVAGAALDAARAWTFEPAMQNGQSVASEHTILFNFTPPN